ncbi:MAG: N-acetylmuramoyl-L-alanine amidase [Gemmatirosa sp.]|nr:N-acetylmuramoyl-L-alanine amidase [Gemmatirosa sp.]
MIRAAHWVLQVAAAAALQPSTAPRPLAVRPAPDVTREVSVERRGDGTEFVRADRLAAALGGSFSIDAGAGRRARLRIGTTTFVLDPELPFVRAGDDVVSLIDAPRLENGRLWVPMQLATDVLPRAARNLIYDAERRELRVFAPVATAPRPVAPGAQSKPVAAAPTVAPSRAAPPPSEATRAPARPRGTHVIVVDAGHGGQDSGMHGPLGGGPAVEEKDVTLAIARQLRETLRARGVEVVMTRTRDTLIALADRGRIANQERGELFVSIHVNAANPAWRDAAGARGFETYFLADAKSEDARRVAALENESVRFETGPAAPATDALGFIISDMAQNEHLRESSRLATLVQRRLAKVHPGPSRGVKQAGFKVLVTASMPAILVEVGYGTNGGDAAFMTSAAGQQVIAAAIADAAVEYLSRAERAGPDGATP